MMDGIMNPKKWFGWYFNIPLVWRILSALVLGAVAGFIVGPQISVLEPLGTLMIKLLKMIILPLIFFAIVMGVGSTPASKIGRVAGKIIIYYFITTFLAATLGFLIANIFKPGLSLGLSAAAGAGSNTLGTPVFSQIFLNMIPDNVVASFASASYLQVLVFAVFFGLAVSILRDSKSERIKESVISVYKFCEGGAEIMFAITKAVLEYTPIGIFVLISIIIAQEGTKFISSAAMIIILCYVGYLCQLFIVYGTLLSLNKINFFKFISRAKDAMLMAFATRSSSATLPLTLKVAEEKMGVQRNVGGFTLPLGSQINLDGEAYYQIIAVYTAAFASGMHLTLAQQILVILVITIGSTGTAGIAGSGPVILLGVMGMIGLNVEAGTIGGAVFALILGIDVILDMGRTAINVTGDLVGTCVVAKSEGLMDLNKWEKNKTKSVNSL